VPYAQAELPYSTSIPPRFFYSKALNGKFSVFGGLIIIKRKFASAKFLKKGKGGGGGVRFFSWPKFNNN
jgi:hypothetical protein